MWFTFKFVSLNHWKQQEIQITDYITCCDLLSNLYLWTIGNNFTLGISLKTWVVIYFQICIFEPLETTTTEQRTTYHQLWFTFKFVSLNHWKQPSSEMAPSSTCCDLLSNLYLWTIGNNWKSRIYWVNTVVIYFQICIFEPLETTLFELGDCGKSLWFTFKFVSLNHWKQQILDYKLSTNEL